MPRGFTMLPSYYEAIRSLSDSDRLLMYDAVMDYAFQAKEPKGLSPVLNGFFTLLRPNIDSSIKHYSASVENGRKGGRPPKEKPNQNPAKTQAKPSENREKEKDKEKDREKETERENIKADKPPRPRFIPPTVEEVRTYCRERKNLVDPERFVDHYTAKGWLIGRNPMKDWKAAVRTWEKDNKKKGESNVQNTTGDSQRNWNLPGVKPL